MSASADVPPHDAPRRPRGRPRKAPEAIDEGNRRQALLHAAAALFRSRGYAGASTRDIASAAGMQSGSPFYHFSSKRVLLFEVIAQGMRGAVQRQAQTLAGLGAGAGGVPPPPERVLRALIRAHLDILHGPSSDFIPVMLYEWRSLTPAQREAVVALRHAYEANWKPSLDALHRAGRLRADPGLARLLVLGALNWSVQWFDEGGSAGLDDLADSALSLFVRPAPQEPAAAGPG